MIDIDAAQVGNGERPDFVLKAGLMIDGHRDIQARRNVSIVIRSGRIGQISSSTSADSTRVERAEVEHHDFSDCTVLPGLIDAHVHLTLPGDSLSPPTDYPADLSTLRNRILTNAEKHLSSGVTTLRDLGSPIEALEVVNSDIVEDPLRYPRLLMYGQPLTKPDGHMRIFGGVCQDRNEIRAVATRNLVAGADGIKIVTSGGGTAGTVPHEATFSQDEIAAAVEIAQAAGKAVTAHAIPVEAIRRALDAGCRGVEHVSFLGPDGENAYDPALASELASIGTVVGSTLAVNYLYLSLAEKRLVPGHEVSIQRRKTNAHLANARRLHQAGVTLIAGSDAGWKITPFGSFRQELELLSQAGLSIPEVIHSATAGPAAALDLSDIGRITPGRLADLLVVRGDVLSDLGALEHVQAVYRGGKRVFSRSR